MNKFLFSIVGFAVVLFLSSSCRVNVLRGEGKKGTSTLSVSDFKKIEITIPVNASIMVQEGATPSVKLDGYQNILSHIKTKVENNTLYIYTELNETWSMDDGDPIVVTISTALLSELSMSRAAEADIHGNIAGGNFKLDLSGASKVVIDNINVTDFSTEASGASNIEVNGGTVQHARYEISGAGKIRTFPLQAAEVNLSISGAGNGQVTALQKLSASISGAGSVKYKGHPVLNQDISGAGSITDAN